jgi:hypothetical protein
MFGGGYTQLNEGVGEIINGKAGFLKLNEIKKAYRDNADKIRQLQSRMLKIEEYDCVKSLIFSFKEDAVCILIILSRFVIFFKNYLCHVISPPVMCILFSRFVNNLQK